MNFRRMTILLGLMAPSLLAAWELIPLDRLISGSDVILIGKLAYVKRAEPGPEATDLGYLEAAELLKGVLPDGRGVVLAFPGRRGSFGSDGKFHSTLTAQDLRFEEGLEACWFLKHLPGTDSYGVDHPACVEPYPFYDGIRAAVARASSAPGH